MSPLKSEVCGWKSALQTDMRLVLTGSTDVEWKETCLNNMTVLHQTAHWWRRVQSLRNHLVWVHEPTQTELQVLQSKPVYTLMWLLDTDILLMHRLSIVFLYHLLHITWNCRFTSKLTAELPDFESTISQNVTKFFSNYPGPPSWFGKNQTLYLDYYCPS